MEHVAELEKAKTGLLLQNADLEQALQAQQLRGEESRVAAEAAHAHLQKQLAESLVQLRAAEEHIETGAARTTALQAIVFVLKNENVRVLRRCLVCGLSRALLLTRLVFVFVAGNCGCSNARRPQPCQSLG